MADGAGGSPYRVARPQPRYMPHGKEYADAWSRLLSKIDSYYTEARDRLAVPARPVTLARLLHAGVCIGLLDPVSNIMVNTISNSDCWPDLGREVLSGAAVDEKLRDMGRSSLEGLVAFLIYFFPYLADWEATRYLLLADADLLVAVRLIVADRGMLPQFSLNSPASAPAFEAALKLAAQIAKHPHPKRLVRVWMVLSSRLQQALRLLSDVQCHSPRNTLESLEAMLNEPVVLSLHMPWDLMAWDLAAHRPQYKNGIGANMPYQHTRSLRMTLLDTIHGFYLQALSMLPRNELRSHLHRSLLRAGYCYGPLDPVSNIIYNTLWYHANFPAAVTPVLGIIFPDSLTRLETRSFYGLVSFLLTRYHDLSEHQAVQCLVAACGDLSLADSVKQGPCSSVQEAYMAAATAAGHPNPKEQATFLDSWKVHRVMRQATSEDVQRWCSILSPKQPPTPERICKSSYHARAGRVRCEAKLARISRKVKAALDRNLLQDGKPAYDLHIIACVNESVCGPEYCDDVPVSESFAPYRFRYSHINFLATEKGFSSSVSHPRLFFAEFDNEEDSAALLCCPVSEPKPFAEHVRCLYCEAVGARVVHPSLKDFHGGGSEFEAVIREEHEHSLTNARVICQSDFYVERMCALEDDYMYAEVK
ncbi:hypothetical protein BS78_05G062800 [Paspalum vaginatum]|nr:hypothetical protein BS78_05G062800 [Paspalum vaginatum]